MSNWQLAIIAVFLSVPLAGKVRRRRVRGQWLLALIISPPMVLCTTSPARVAEMVSLNCSLEKRKKSLFLPYILPQIVANGQDWHIFLSSAGMKGMSGSSISSVSVFIAWHKSCWAASASFLDTVFLKRKASFIFSSPRIIREAFLGPAG